MHPRIQRSYQGRHLEQWTEGRQENAARYDRVFSEAGAATGEIPFGQGKLPLRTPQPARGLGTHIYNQYVIRVPAAVRDPLRQHLKGKGIGTAVYYPVPLHRQPCFAYLGYAEGSLPHSEAAAAQTIALPIYAELTEQQLTHVTGAVIAFLEKHAPAAQSACT